MWRILGFLLGIFLVIMLVIALVRYPVTQFVGGETPPPPVGETGLPAGGPGLETLPRADEAAPVVVTIDESDQTETDDSKPEAEDPVAEPAEEAGGEGEPAAAATREWHAFWQPFRSRISAEGFVTRLERLTGLDFRVVSSRPGEYQAAFAYADEAERQANLAAIEAATGLAVRNKVL